MRKPLLRGLVMLVLACVLFQPFTASADELALMPGSCSLVLEYSRDGQGFTGLEISIYRVAEIYEDGSYALTAPFDVYPVKIHDIQSQMEWREAADTLAAYIEADQLEPTSTALTDEQGRAYFSELETGLYLVREVSGRNEEGICVFENFLLFLPTPNADGTASFDVQAKPKSTVIPEPEPEEITYQVLKLWKDEGSQNQRPASITVDILKNGEVQETVVLDTANNWSYTWTVPKGDDVWTVVERDVPEGYTVVITSNQTIFTITNTGEPPEPTTPETGDTFPLQLCILAMCASGIMLIVLGIWRKRKLA